MTDFPAFVRPESQPWPMNMAVLHGLFESVHYVIPRGLDQTASVAQLAEQLICNQQVAGSTPAASSIACITHAGGDENLIGRMPTHTHEHTWGSFPSGQRGQTVNLMAYAFAGSNPALPSFARAVGLAPLVLDCRGNPGFLESAWCPKQIGFMPSVFNHSPKGPQLQKRGCLPLNGARSLDLSMRV